MTEAEAHEWLADVPRETISRISQYIQALAMENQRQNLVASSTLHTIWSRHIVDSAQLLRHTIAGSWLDLGSGAGFPGLIIALIGDRPVILIESRARRASFLQHAAFILGVDHHVEIIAKRLETVPPRPFAVISARAFAPLLRLLELAHPFSTPQTRWLLPKGRGAAQELEAARDLWQGDFRIVPSVTDPKSAIIVASDVRRKARR